MFLPKSSEQQSHPHCERRKQSQWNKHRRNLRWNISLSDLRTNFFFPYRDRYGNCLASHSIEASILGKLRTQLRTSSFACTIYRLEISLLLRSRSSISILVSETTNCQIVRRCSYTSIDASSDDTGFTKWTEWKFQFLKSIAICTNTSILFYSLVDSCWGTVFPSSVCHIQHRFLTNCCFTPQKISTWLHLKISLNLRTLPLTKSAGTATIETTASFEAVLHVRLVLSSLHGMSSGRPSSSRILTNPFLTPSSFISRVTSPFSVCFSNRCSSDSSGSRLNCSCLAFSVFTCQEYSYFIPRFFDIRVAFRFWSAFSTVLDFLDKPHSQVYDSILHQEFTCSANSLLRRQLGSHLRVSSLLLRQWSQSIHLNFVNTAQGFEFSHILYLFSLCKW